MVHYAHSGNGCIESQTYESHIKSVISKAVKNTNICLQHCKLSNTAQAFFRWIIEISAAYHDLGKLDPHTQTTLSQINPPRVRLINHVDAGVAYLLREYQKTNNTVYLISAFFVLCHHIGLQNWDEFVEEVRGTGLFPTITYKTKDAFRCDYNIKEKYEGAYDIDKSLKDYTDEILDGYLKDHHIYIPPFNDIEHYNDIPLTPFQLRMAFSCLIDADHHDTSHHYSGGLHRVDFGSLLPSRRLQELEIYVSKLHSPNASKKRQATRKKLFKLCGKTDVSSDKMYLLDGTVGTGKTCSGLKLALRIAQEQNQERLYYVAPFTNIISQTAHVYKSAIRLNGEPIHNINEIHCKVEFQDPKLRMFNNLWSAPINCTTAVQFIESLAKHYTPSIRKMHLFANSVVILDEFHTMMPYHLWNYVLDLMWDLSENFNTAFVFSSGSNIAYWDIFDKWFEPKQVVSEKIYRQMITDETRRVKIKKFPEPFETPDHCHKEIMKVIKRKKLNNAMIVVNTIHNACVLTRKFIAEPNGYQIYHLSSYLTPRDRVIVLKKIKRELKRGTKLILIATSIIECGVDASFQLGFRQKCNASSVIQFNGRVNREFEMRTTTTFLFDFSNDAFREHIFTENPLFSVGKKILSTLPLKEITPEYCTDIVLREMDDRPKHPKQDRLPRLEILKKYKDIGEDFCVIDSHTITIIIDPEIQASIKNKEYVSFRKIIKNSIQLWFTRLEDSRFHQYIEIIEDEENVENRHYFWTGPYDPMYGIGAIL